jgi:6-hydroxytryprostatin B O-methyltransferase
MSRCHNSQLVAASIAQLSTMPSIKELSEKIASNSALVEKWLTSKNAKAPSFEQDAEEEFPSTAGEAEIEAARLAILDDTNTLHDLLIGPGEVLRQICWGVS